MHPTHFEEAAARTRLSDKGKAAARAVLVDGRKQADVAREFGVDRSAVARYVRSLLVGHGEVGHFPPTWETVTVTVPKRLAQQIRKLARRARQDHGIRQRHRPKKR